MPPKMRAESMKLPEKIKVPPKARQRKYGGGRPPKHPWDQVRDHYITAESLLTLKELAEIYDIPYVSVRNKSGDERWPYLRADYQTKHQVALREARSKELVKESLGFDDTSLKAAKLGQNLILGRLSQIAAMFQAQGVQFETVLNKLRQGIPLAPHEMRSTINYKELTELANALDRFQTVGRKALGMDGDKLDITFSNSTIGDVNIREELEKPDLDRTAAVVEAMRRAGLESLLHEQLQLTSGEDDEDDDADGEAAENTGTEVLVGEVLPKD